jgi:ribosomal protein S4
MMEEIQDLTDKQLQKIVEEVPINEWVRKEPQNELQRKLHPPAKSFKALLKEREAYYEGLRREKEKETSINIS